MPELDGTGPRGCGQGMNRGHRQGQCKRGRGQRNVGQCRFIKEDSQRGGEDELVSVLKEKIVDVESHLTMLKQRLNEVNG